MDDFTAKAATIEQSSPYLAAFRRAGPPLLATPWYDYNHHVAALASGAIDTAFLQTRPDSDFVCTYVSAICLVASAVSTPATLLQITELSTNKPFFSKAAQLQTVMGQLSFSLVLPTPRFLAANVKLRFDVTNNGPDTADFFFSLRGKRLYYGGGS